MDVTINVTEVEPSWLLIAFQGAKPAADARPFWLSKSLTDWLATHPGRVDKRTLPVQHEGELVALHVWLDSAPAAALPLTVKIDQNIIATQHKEHLEAFMQQAHTIFFERPEAPLLAVINRTGIAAVFNRDKEQAYLVPASVLEVEEATMAEINDWLSAPDGPYF